MNKIFPKKNKIIPWIKRHKIISGLILIVIISISSFFIFRKNPTDKVQTFSVVQKISKGTVSSGIETTGKILAAQKLNLDVYKKKSRIDVVNIKNGDHVEAGKVLVSFDKGDASVSARTSAISVTEAELKLKNVVENADSPNNQIRTLENKIKEYKESIANAYKNFLNTDIKLDSMNYATKNKTRPTLSGKYIKEGENYRILIDVPSFNDRYRIESLLIYKVYDSSGRISEHELIYNIATPIADTGLYITFNKTINPEVGDKWQILVPNTGIYTHSETKKNYEEMVRGLEVNLENAKQDLTNLTQVNSSAYRNLDVEQAELSLAAAKQRLSENYSSINERNIIAPFAGSVQDMENVVVGATPTGGSEDSISLGTLVSDEYIVTFTLDATDIAKIKTGQKVEVTITSYPNQPKFNATISEISSLPASSGVAQYDVKAKLDYDAKTADITIREGMLSNVVIIQEEKENVLRVPTSAIVYEEGKPVIKIVDSLNEEQQQQFEKLGIVRVGNVELVTYSSEVQLGVGGRFYTEILSGAEDGMKILITETKNTSVDSRATVRQQSFVPPSGTSGMGSNSSRTRPMN